MYTAAYADHSNSDCFACAILTHGDDDIVYGIDRSLPIKTILCQFNSLWCRGLSNKPKLFFFQVRYDKCMRACVKFVMFLEGENNMHMNARTNTHTCAHTHAR